MGIKLTEELRHLDLGDKRRNKRMARIVAGLVNNPGQSIPKAGYSWSDTKMTYSFYNNEEVSELAIADCIHNATADRCLQNDTILSIHDTTSLNFDSSAAGLGYLDHGKGEGLMLHNTLAIDEQGCALGLLHQKIWARDPATIGKKKTRSVRKIEDKESYRWIEGIRKADTLLKDIKRVIHVADREADIYELFTDGRPAYSELLIRCTHDRKTLLGNSMWEEVAAEKVLASFELKLPKSTTEADQTVMMEVKAGAVLLSPPASKPGLPAMLVYGLLVQQVGVASAKKLEWKLITTMPVLTAADALNTVRWYSYRWRIERFHYILKSGCRLEDLQLRDVDALRKATLVYSLSAFKLMQLLYLAREQPNLPCSSFLDQDEWQMLVLAHSKSPVVNKKEPTLQQSIIMIARLGGYLARNNDSPPGIKTLWQGLQQLNTMVKTIRLQRQWFSPS